MSYFDKLPRELLVKIIQESSLLGFQYRNRNLIALLNGKEIWCGYLSNAEPLKEIIQSIKSKPQPSPYVTFQGDNWRISLNAFSLDYGAPFYFSIVFYKGERYIIYQANYLLPNITLDQKEYENAFIVGFSQCNVTSLETALNSI